MCRLFGMTTGGPRVSANFWLLDAPESLAKQSERMPDGTGLGWFSLGGEPVLDRAPIAAFNDADFAREARFVTSHTFIAHVRYASTGALTVHNTHPFDIRDRLFAHNGVLKGLDVLRSWLSDLDKVFIEGETDSELLFAYISAEIARHQDTTEGIVAAVDRIGKQLPVFALNFLLAEPGKIWALRYPETHPLWVLTPEVGAMSGPTTLRGGSEPGGLEVDLDGPSPKPAVLIASERMDDDPGWRLLDPGELLIADGLNITSLFPFNPPAHQLWPDDLSDREASSQDPALEAV